MRPAQVLGITTSWRASLVLISSTATSATSRFDADCPTSIGCYPRPAQAILRKVASTCLVPVVSPAPFHLASEQGGKRARVEDDLKRADLPLRDLIPFRDERRPGRCVRHHVVEDTDIVTVHKDLLQVIPLDDRRQLLQGFEIRVGRVKRVQGPPECHVVPHQLACSSEVLRVQRRPIPLNNLACSAHRIFLPLCDRYATRVRTLVGALCLWSRRRTISGRP